MLLRVWKAIIFGPRPPPPFAISSPPPPTQETVTWPKKHRKYEAPKKIFRQVVLEFGGHWHKALVLGCLPLGGGRPSLGDRLPPPKGKQPVTSRPPHNAEKGLWRLI